MFGDAPRKRIVGEDGMGSKKDVVLNRNPVPDADPVLDRDVIAKDGPGLHEGHLTDIAVFADDSPFHHVGKRPDSRPFADGVRFVDSFGMNVEISHSHS